MQRHRGLAIDDGQFICETEGRDKAPAVISTVRGLVAAAVSFVSDEDPPALQSLAVR